MRPTKRITATGKPMPIIRCTTCDRTLLVQRVQDAIKEWFWTLEDTTGPELKGQCYPCQKEKK